MLRWRCDARVFKPLLIEIIARQKVAPAFEPEKVSRRTAPRPPDPPWWGGRGEPENLSGPIFHSSVRQLLRWRCDARVFKPLLIEIIARQKVAPAFEPKNWDGWMARAAIDN